MNSAISIIVISIVFLCDHTVLGDITSPKWRKGVLDRHNFYRARHGVPPLKHSADLCDFSQKYADHLADTRTFDHSTNEARDGAGENLLQWESFGDGDINVSPEQVVDYWYNEIKDYDFTKGRAKNGKTFFDIGHFTQVIWKTTSKLCTSYAKHNGLVVIVAHYKPHANFPGEFTKNVPRPIKGERRNADGNTNSGTPIQRKTHIISSYMFFWLTTCLIYEFV